MIISYSISISRDRASINVEYSTINGTSTSGISYADTKFQSPRHK